MDQSIMLHWVDQCVSTQDELMAADISVSAIATLNQLRGRGRRGKTWYSPQGASLAVSWRAPIAGLNVEAIPLISLAAGVALYRWVSTLCLAESVPRSRLSQLHLKWPNDLLFAQKKCAGILCEGRIDTHGHSVIVGIGINLIQHDLLPPQSSYLAELMSDHHQSYLTMDRLFEITPLLVKELECSVSELRLHQAQLLDHWQEYSLPIGTMLQAAGHQGIYLGINHQGALLLDIGERVISVEGGEVNLISLLSTQ